ncbi:RNA polymerase subunit sigma-70 [Brachyspira pilosicoli]|uniref:RNA polymerase subunit sigma-70 n=1 Tax=Brachyspira pilosicoli TaxID=52584 RepID=UPI00300439A1
MFKYLFLIFTIIINIIACSSKNVTFGEINAVYNKKEDSYTISFPEYNKIYPEYIKLEVNKKIKNGIVLNYNIETDNIPTLLDICVEEDNIKKSYSIVNPVVNQIVNIELYATNFTPHLSNEKIKYIEISLESVGNYDTKEKVKISLNEKINEYNNTIALVLPESGHIAKSNPPFFMVNKKLNFIRVYLAQDLSFNNAHEYTIRNNNFFDITNKLDSGKWYIALDENGDTNLRKIYHFFITDKTKNINIITNRVANTQRPFIFADSQTLNLLNNIYNSKRIQQSAFLRNFNYFKLYTSNNVGKWYLDNISYTNNDNNKIYFENIPSHIMLMSLRAYLEEDNTSFQYDIKQMIKDIALLNENNIENFNNLEASYILANSLLMPFDILYDKLSSEEVVLIKQKFIDYGNILYKYIINNPSLYRDANNIKYITTLGLISLNMLNENLYQEEVRNWYLFSLKYVNSMIFSMFEDDGSLKASLDNSFEIIFNIFIYANALKNAEVVNVFEYESFRNIGKYLSIIGYPSGYTLPVGYTLIDGRSKMRFDNGARSAIMELLSKIYNNALYKNYSVFGQSEAIDIKYLPYMLLWNNHSIKDDALSALNNDYQSAYFRNIETAIYNRDIKSLNSQYLAIYAKGNNAYKSYGLNHNDRMSFVYYNYGDSIIDELGYFYNDGNKEIFRYADFHNIITISDTTNEYRIEEKPSSFSEIISTINNNKLFFAKAKANNVYTYKTTLRNFERTFYYLKPNILIIKEDIEALPNINNENYINGYKYKWNINSKLPISNNNDGFIIEGKYSTSYIKLLLEDKLNYEVSETNIGNQKLYTAKASTIDNTKKFSPWIMVITMPKNNVDIKERRNIINTNITINSFSYTNLSFKAGYKNYNIIYKSTNNNEKIVYTENRENVIISSH